MYHARRLAIRRAAAGLNGNALFNNNIAAKRSIFSWFKGPTDHVDATPTLNGTQDHGGPMRETRALLPTPQPAKLFNELLRQDPRGRVRVMAPWFFEEDLFTLAYHFHTLHPDLPPEPERIEIHCIPMWTVIYLQSCESARLDRRTGAVQGGSGLTVIDYGCSVSAVPDNHWASNLVLRDDIRELAGRVAEQAMQRDLISPGADDAAWRQWMNDLDILETNAVPFAKGYPKLTKAEMSAITKMSEAGVIRRGSGEDYGPDSNLGVYTHDNDTIAVPTYRPVCRAIYPTGTAYWDGLYPPFWEIQEAALHPLHFRLPNTDPKLAVDTMTAGFGLPYRRWMPADKATIKREEDRLQKSLPFIGAAEEDATTFANYIMRAMNRAKLDWEDPNILSADADGGSGIYDLVSHAESRIANVATTSRLPQAFRPQDRARDVNSGPSLLKRPVITRPVKLRTGTLGGQRPAPLRPATAALGQRPKPLPLPGAPPPQLPLGTSRTPQAVRPVAKVEVHDVDNAYRRLGLSGSVNGSYLDPLSEDTVNRTIANARRILQLAYHPDLVDPQVLQKLKTKTGQTKQTENPSAVINAAYDRVRDLSARLAYQRKGKRDP